MQVEPDQVINPAVGARISHGGSGTLVVTIESETGAQDTVQVPPGQTVTWYPPPGWQSATFRADGHEEEFRTIQQEAAARQEAAAGG